MSDRYTLLKRVDSLDESPQFDSYSRVVIHVADDTETSGEKVVAYPPLDDPSGDAGMTFEIENPLGTVEMAQRMLERLRGYRYQPYKSDGALLDPTAEIGDGVSIKDVYGGIYKRSRKFGRLMEANIEAPHDEEIDHEYKYESPSERRYKRDIGYCRATLLIHNDEISARVSKTGGNNSSFGWSLLADHFSLFSGSKEVFRADRDGVAVSGRVNITSGAIGDPDSGGFHITATAIWNGIDHFNADSPATGIYLGTNGIQLGRNFKVDSGGNLEAQTGRFGGTVFAGNVALGRGGGGTMGGDKLTGGSVASSKLDRDTQAAIAAAKVFDQMRHGLTQIGNVICGTLSVGGYQASWMERRVMNASGTGTTTIRYLGR